MAVEAALILWAFAIAVSDVRWLRVPNLLLLLILVPAVAAQVVNGRGLLQVDAVSALTGAGLGFLLTIIGYVARQMGAGDVKYATLLGFLVGYPGIGRVLLLSALIVGLLSLVAWLMARRIGVSAGKVPAALALSVAFVVYLVGGIEL